MIIRPTSYRRNIIIRNGLVNIALTHSHSYPTSTVITLILYYSCNTVQDKSFLWTQVVSGERARLKVIPSRKGLRSLKSHWRVHTCDELCDGMPSGLRRDASRGCLLFRVLWRPYQRARGNTKWRHPWTWSAIARRCLRRHLERRGGRAHRTGEGCDDCGKYCPSPSERRWKGGNRWPSMLGRPCRLVMDLFFPATTACCSCLLEKYQGCQRATIPRHTTPRSLGTLLAQL